MKVLRVTHPGGAFVHWVPPPSTWKGRGATSQAVSVERMEWNDKPPENWHDAIRDHLENDPHTIIQYEGEPHLMPIWTRHMRPICILRHLKHFPPKSARPYVVVPSYFAREALRRKKYQALTVPPFVEARFTDDLEVPAGAEDDSLTVLLHPQATTIRLLRAIEHGGSHQAVAEWLVLDQGSKRGPLIKQTLCQSGLRSRLVSIEEIGAWQRVHAMITDQHPIYSLNVLHCYALAYCIPVLTTAIGDHPELVKHRYNGFLLSSSPMQLCHELTDYLSLLKKEPTLIEQLRENGRRLYEAYYSPPHTMRIWHKLIESRWGRRE